MALILRVPGVSFTDTTIPPVRNDRIANAGTLDVFDALDADVSWPSQADPVEGVGTWKSLMSDSTAAFAGTVGWDGGFTIDATPDTITMPPSFKLGATSEGVVIFWIEIGTQAFTSGTNNYIARVGNIGSASQWICFLNYGVDDANTRIGVYSANNASQLFSIAISTLPANRIVQVAISMELVGGVYVYTGFLNGVQVGTFTTALTSLPQPSSQMYFGGSTNAFNGKVLRALVDDLSATTPEELVALDWATYSTRFAA